MDSKLSNEALQARRKYMPEYKSQMSQEARNKANEYMRQWRRSNPDKVRVYNDTYWERKVNKMAVTDNVTDNLTVTELTVSCQQCNKVFTPKRSDARFCSDTCRVRYNRKFK